MQTKISIVETLKTMVIYFGQYSPFLERGGRPEYPVSLVTLYTALLYKYLGTS